MSNWPQPPAFVVWLCWTIGIALVLVWLHAFVHRQGWML